MRRRGRRAEIRDLAAQRMRLLLKMADEIYPREPELGLRYGDLAKKISLRTRIRIPREWRWRYCKRCGSLLYPGINADIRVRERRFPHLVIKCKLCGEVRRIPYLREKRSARRR